MSLSLYWQPTPKPTESYQLSYELKTRLARRYWDHDGSVFGERITLHVADIPYIEGLADCGIEDADNLVKYIKQYGSVDIWIGS